MAVMRSELSAKNAVQLYEATPKLTEQQIRSMLAKRQRLGT